MLLGVESDAFDSNSVLLPQRLALPFAREAHGGDIDGRVSGEQGIDLRLHVVVGRNDVEEILDNAKVKIDAKRVRRQCNPTARHAIGNHWSDSVLLVPYASMVTARVACEGDDGKPRLEGGYLKAELAGNALLDTRGLDVAEDLGDNTEGKYFGQYPSGRIGIGIGLLEVDDEVFARTV